MATATTCDGCNQLAEDYHYPFVHIPEELVVSSAIGEVVARMDPGDYCMHCVVAYLFPGMRITHK